MSYIKTFRGLNEPSQGSEIDNKIADSYHTLIHTEAASTATSSTNATGWGCEEYEVESYEIAEDEIVVELSWSASGDQDPDKGYCGTKISGHATAVIDDDGRIVYRDVTAEVDTDDYPDAEA